jgi:carbon storage regulator CsrA
MSLVLTIKENGALHLETMEGEVVIRVVGVGQSRVRLVVDAPPSVKILRGELKEQPLVPQDV